MYLRRLLLSLDDDKIIDYNQSDYLTMEILSDYSSVSFSTKSNNLLEYSVNKKNWKTYKDGSSIPNLKTGDIVCFRGDFVNAETFGIGQFSISGYVNLTGNCMSILYGDDAKSYDYVPYACFYALFRYCGGIVNVSENFLPATKLSYYCYSRMFDNSGIVTAPNLPATVLDEGCYNGMFYYCFNLNSAPKINATTLAPYCCDSMFYRCTSLLESPVLYAETTVHYCYQAMFQLCSNLNKITMLAKTITEENDMFGWVSEVSSTGTFVKSKDATWDIIGHKGVPEGWTIEYQ